MIKHFKYVHFEDIHIWHKLGWMIDGVNPGTHGYYGVMMMWPCSCPVRLPE